jgi:DNA mismatch endonuclease Vsr
MVRAGIRGWSINARAVIGKPDFVFSTQRLAVFVDGCFWHGCPKCRKIPATNVAYWSRKIYRNRARDRRSSSRLRKDGWTVLRVWEHHLRDLGRVIARIRAALGAAK